MRRSTMFTIFFCAFCAVMVAMNWYFFSRFFAFINLRSDIIFYSSIVFTMLAFPLATFMEKRYPNWLSRTLYILSALWIGVVFVTVSLLALLDLLDWISPFPINVKESLFFTITLLILTYGIWCASRLRITAHTIPIKGLKTPMHIVHLSDIHLGTVRSDRFLQKIVERVGPINPDAVMITGDLIDGSAPIKPHMFDALKRLKMPVFYVTGNHEFYEGIDEVYKLLSTTNLQVLKDKAVEFKGVQIVGVQYSMERNHLQKTLPKMANPKSLPRILLYHVPAEISVAKKEKVNLMLSGHTHFGQIFPFTLLVRFAFRHIKGLYTYGDFNLYVSRGTGTWGPYMRLGSYNEIALMELVPKK